MTTIVAPNEVKNIDDPKLLDSLAYDLSYEIRCEVAKNPHTKKGTLNFLASDSNYEVQLAVAQNPNAGHYGLHILGTQTTNVRLALYVAQNRATLVKTLRIMLDLWQDNKIILRAIRMHPNADNIIVGLCQMYEDM